MLLLIACFNAHHGGRVTVVCLFDPSPPPAVTVDVDIDTALHCGNHRIKQASKV